MKTASCNDNKLCGLWFFLVVRSPMWLVTTQLKCQSQISVHGFQIHKVIIISNIVCLSYMQQQSHITGMFVSFSIIPPVHQTKETWWAQADRKCSWRKTPSSFVKSSNCGAQCDRWALGQGDIICRFHQPNVISTFSSWEIHSTIFTNILVTFSLIGKLKQFLHSTINGQMIPIIFGENMVWCTSTETSPVCEILEVL